MDLGISGNVAIVTGAGRGIGRAIALALAKEGAIVVVNAMHKETAEEVAQSIISMGSRSLAVQADVSQPDQVDRMVNRTLDEFERWIFINNAGSFTTRGLSLENCFGIAF
jgi:NAD(P)-dependent dehydrogenase (short-subunit alcohol dehydrogenase family)